VLTGLPRAEDERLLVGTEHPDDAAVVRLPGGDALVQTVDLIAPIVNDPATFGKVAAANSISDVYAMGGRPLTAMNIVVFPVKQLPLTVLREVMDGALEVLRESQCLMVGGHTVTSDELMFGLSVSGLVEGNIWSIDRAQVGDVLVLTKPLGTGVVNQALRKGKLDDTAAVYRQAVESMTTLNAAGMSAGRAAQANAATDITGFGLLGHGAQFARASQVTFEIDARAVPFFDGVRALAESGVVPGRAKDNAAAYRDMVSGVTNDLDAALLFDPQTSGGLLVSVPEANVAVFRSALSGWKLGAAVVGRVVKRGEHPVVVR
jgi:selenide,water dikinase